MLCGGKLGAETFPTQLSRRLQRVEDVHCPKWAFLHPGLLEKVLQATNG